MIPIDRDREREAAAGAFGRRPREGVELRARTTTTDDGTTELTIYDANSPPAEQTTRWVTAVQEACVDLESHC